MDYQNLLQGFEECIVQHTYREGNRVADVLAKMGSYQSDKFFIHYHFAPPNPETSFLLALDNMNVLTARRLATHKPPSSYWFGLVRKLFKFQSFRFYYYTAGSGGAVPTILATRFLLLGEENLLEVRSAREVLGVPTISAQSRIAPFF
ncbi:hypothetical protein CFP56_012597 [Quercus suber]|uniref:RNase H type-1 domain-containing protein n=1 Tax=Quercus suber TaxID=58331 RepID=A0AAW0KZH5_QUESU